MVVIIAGPARQQIATPLAAFYLGPYHIHGDSLRQQ